MKQKILTKSEIERIVYLAFFDGNSDNAKPTTLDEIAALPLDGSANASFWRGQQFDRSGLTEALGVYVANSGDRYNARVKVDRALARLFGASHYLLSYLSSFVSPFQRSFSLEEIGSRLQRAGLTIPPQDFVQDRLIQGHYGLGEDSHYFYWEPVVAEPLNGSDKAVFEGTYQLKYHRARRFPNHENTEDLCLYLRSNPAF